MPEKNLDINYSRFILPFGPVHPSLKEPLGVRVALNKEIVESCELSVGFANRGIERLATSRNIIQAMHLIERVCGICSSSHSLCFTRGIEQVANIEVQLHVNCVRLLVAELERVHSHLLCIGLLGYQLGFETFFMNAFAFREKIMDVFEIITGNRVHHGINAIGGLRIELTREAVERTREHVLDIAEAAKQLGQFITDGLIRKRTRGIGVITRDQAITLGLVGPVAKASGVATDLRKETPYSGYGEIRNAFSVVTRESGDVYDRNEIRIIEIGESCKIILALLEMMPSSPVPRGANALKMMRRVPEGHFVSSIEAPRGRLEHAIWTNGRGGLSRIQITTPTLINVKAMDILLVGAELADVPVILASIDPCISCMDR